MYEMKSISILLVFGMIAISFSGCIETSNSIENIVAFANNNELYKTNKFVGEWKDTNNLKITFYHNGNGIMYGYMFGEYYQSKPFSYKVMADNRVILTYETVILGSQTYTTVSQTCVYKFGTDKFTNEKTLQIHNLDQGSIKLKKYE